MFARLENIWTLSHKVLDEMDLKVEMEDRTAGFIRTKPHEFVSGTLAAEELAKVAVLPDPRDGVWVKGRFSLMVETEVVRGAETLVTISTKVEALKREFSGQERWIELKSLGTLERRFLGRLNLKLFGNELESPGKEGFWDKKPQPVPEPKNKPPNLAKPDRDRP